MRRGILCKGVVVSGAEIIQAQIRVELLTPIHHLVGCGAADGELIAEGVVFVAVCDGFAIRRGMPEAPACFY